MLRKNKKIAILALPRPMPISNQECGSGSCGSGKFLWKRKQKLKAVKKGTASATNLTIYIRHQNSNVVQFFKKYMTKNDCLIDRHLQRTFLKALVHLYSG